MAEIVLDLGPPYSYVIFVKQRETKLMKSAAFFFVLFASISPFCSSQTLKQVCGAPVVSTDAQGNPNVVACPSEMPGECTISLSFLKCVSTSSSGDPGIRVNPGDDVEWYSDQKDKNGNLIEFKFDKFKQLGKSDHANCQDPKNGDKEPFPNAANHGYDVFYDEAADSARSGTCFQHNIKLRASDGSSINFDPHIFVGDGTPYLPLSMAKRHRMHPARAPRR